MKQSRRAAWGISAIAGVLLLATGCTAGSGAASNGSGKAPYVLGVLTSQTGGASQLGDCKHGASHNGLCRTPQVPTEFSGLANLAG